MHDAFGRVMAMVEQLDTDYRTAALATAINRVAKAARLLAICP
jgi:hypothetical protein